MELYQKPYRSLGRWHCSHFNWCSYFIIEGHQIDQVQIVLGKAVLHVSYHFLAHALILLPEDLFHGLPKDRKEAYWFAVPWVFLSILFKSCSDVSVSCLNASQNAYNVSCTNVLVPSFLFPLEELKTLGDKQVLAARNRCTFTRKASFCLTN